MTKAGNSQIMRTIPLLITIFSLSFPAYAKYNGGTGEPNDPYQIATAGDLILLGETPEDYNKHFILTDDIDLDPNLPGHRVFDKAVIAPDANDANWWFDGTSFTGVFNGNVHTISHLTIEGASFLGLFGQLESGARVSNMRLETVEVTGISDCVGSLVGQNYNGSITTSYSTGSVTGDSRIGGLVGDNGGNITTSYSTGSVTGDFWIGGLVAENLFDNITTSYSTGVVNGIGHHVGGLVGDNQDGSITASLWDIETSGHTTSAGGTGKTTAEMQTASTFLEAGWDFVDETANGTEDIWWILEGQDYPRLWWEDSN